MVKSPFKGVSFFAARGMLDKVEALLLPGGRLGSLVLVFEVFGLLMFLCSLQAAWPEGYLISLLQISS